MNEAPAVRPDPPGRRAAIALAVAVHLLLAVFLIYGINWQTKPPDAVEVQLVSPTVTPPAAKSAQPPEPKPEPRPEPKPQPAPEPKPVTPPKAPDIAVKEKEKPKPPPKEEPKPRFDPTEMLKREDKELATRKEANKAARELDEQQAAQVASARNKAVADYLSKIRAKIRGNIVVPPEIKGNPEAVFDVTQLPSGEILAVKLKKSSGHAALDAAIDRAILKSSPLPKPDAGDVFSRTLELKFRPLDE
jgi:colicin import membrane protein